jgi:hypothetical protein
MIKENSSMQRVAREVYPIAMQLHWFSNAAMRKHTYI